MDSAVQATSHGTHRNRTRAGGAVSTGCVRVVVTEGADVDMYTLRLLGPSREPVETSRGGPAPEANGSTLLNRLVAARGIIAYQAGDFGVVLIGV